MANKLKDLRIPVMMVATEVAAIDEWRCKQPDLPNPSEAIRGLVEIRAKGEEMIGWRLIVPAVLVAAAIAGGLTYFVTPSPPVEAVQQLPPPPDISGPDTGTRANIDQHSSAEEEAKAAFERAAAAILRRAPDLQASTGANKPPTAEHIPLPKRRPPQLP